MSGRLLNLPGGNIRHRIVMSFGPGSSFWPARACLTTSLLLAWTLHGRSSANGASGFVSLDYPAWRRCLGAGGRPASPPIPAREDVRARASAARPSHGSPCKPSQSPRQSARVYLNQVDTPPIPIPKTISNSGHRRHTSGLTIPKLASWNNIPAKTAPRPNDAPQPCRRVPVS